MPPFRTGEQARTVRCRVPRTSKTTCRGLGEFRRRLEVTERQSDGSPRPGETGGGSVPVTAHRPTAGVQHPAEAASKHRRRSHRNPRDASAPEPCQASYYRRRRWRTTSRKSDRTSSRGRELPQLVIERTSP